MTLALKKNIPSSNPEETKIPYWVSQEILKAIQNMKFGSIEITIHDSRVVQIEKKEKFRYQPEYEI